MTDDEQAAIKAVERLLEAKGYRGGTYIRAYNIVHNLALVGLTPADLAGLADGSRVVVPAEPTDEMSAAGSEYLPVTPYGNRKADAASVYTAMVLAARPGAKGDDDAA